MRKIIITGGPGVGKTTILDKMAERGYYTVPEAARAVIEREQARADANADYTPTLPQTNISRFQGHVMREQQNREWAATTQRGTVFLDRSYVDQIGYCSVFNAEQPKQLMDFIGSAGYERVFFLEQLPVHVNDSVRYEDRELATRIHEAIYEAYDRLGFDIVRVPAVGIEERVALIEAELAEQKGMEIEKKFPVDDFDSVRERLGAYEVAQTQDATFEDNRLYDVFGLLIRSGRQLRLRRSNGEYHITYKSPNERDDMLVRRERETFMERGTYRTLINFLPEAAHYMKVRERFQPVGDPSCMICLDRVEGLGTFVEIEAATENQVDLWKERLGITGDSTSLSYTQMVTGMKPAGVA